MILMEDLLSEMERLLTPLEGPSPSGRDLDGSLELNALEMTCLEPEQSVVDGVELVDTRNWRQIKSQTCTLLEQSKDLRIAVQLTRALLQIEGLPGFCAGVCFVSELARKHWDTLYPPMDADDGEPTTRVNAIHELVSAPCLAQLRIARLFTTQSAGTATVNDLLLATSSPLGRPELAVAPSHIVFSVLDSLGVKALDAHLQLIRDTRDQLTALVAFVAERTGVYLQLDVLASPRKNTPGLLDALSQALGAESERLASASAPKVTTAAEGGSDDESRRNVNEISRREDVIVLIERICAYYARVEPSSPVPLLLQRAKRLATMDFLEIVRDLADQGLPQVGNVAGVRVE